MLLNNPWKGCLHSTSQHHSTSLINPIEASNNAIKIHRRTEIVSLGMLAPRKFMQKRKKVEVFRDSDDEADQKRWRKLMNEIEEVGSAVTVLRTQRTKDQPLPKDMVLGTLVRFKQQKKWNLVTEILEWLRTQHWWDFNEMDFLMLITAYGKQGDFNKAERAFSYMTKKGYSPSVISHTALMEAYGRGGEYNKAEAIFRRMQSTGPEPSAVTYQIVLKIFVEGDKFDEAEGIFETLLDKEVSPLKPDQKMFHMMIYMYKKAGRHDKARKLFALMAERGVPQTTVTYNSLMSFETNYKEVAKIYDQMQRADLRPDVVSYALLINAYGKARREEEALAVFEEMLDAGVRYTRGLLLDIEIHQGFGESWVLREGYLQLHGTSAKTNEADGVITLMAWAAACGTIQERFLELVESFRNLSKVPTKHFKGHLRKKGKKTYNILLDAFAISGMVEQARTVFKSMRRDRCTPDLCSYTTMLLAYVNASDIEGAEKFFRRIKVDGFKPNVVTYGTLIKGYAEKNNLEKMMEKYEEMRVCGIKANQTIFTTIMDAYGKNKDFGSAVVWFKEMESCGILPDQKAKNILLSLAKTAEEQIEANQLVGQGDHSASEQTGVDDYDDIDDEDYDDVDEDDAETTISFVGEEDKLILSAGVI